MYSFEELVAEQEGHLWEGKTWEDLGGTVGVPLCVSLDPVSVTSSPSLPPNGTFLSCFGNEPLPRLGFDIYSFSLCDGNKAH